MTTPSIFRRVAAPAPRYMMRLALIERLIRRLPADIGRFLEIGPGLGDLSLHLADRYPNARGELMDISAESEAITRSRVSGRPLLNVRRGDFRQIADSASYDLVVACEVFEHIEDDESAFAAVRSLLRADGLFLFSVPAFWAHWHAADRYAGHFRRYERVDVLDKFARHGFEIDTIWSYGFPVTNLLEPFYHLYYGHKLHTQPLDRSAATQRSGVQRDAASRLPVRLITALLWPMFILQNLVKSRDIGDGFLVLARKR